MPFDRMLTGMGWGDRVLGGAQPGRGGTGLGGNSLGRANVVLVLGVWFQGVGFHGQFFGFIQDRQKKQCWHQIISQQPKKLPHEATFLISISNFWLRLFIYEKLG